MGNRFIVVALLLSLTGVPAVAQRFSVATNLADYANFCTLNLDVSYALSQHWSLTAGAKYNPFSFRSGEVLNKQRTFSLGARWWPWHSYSGLWLSSKAQYMEYSNGGIRSPQTQEGDAYGLGLSGGYSYMLTPHLNVEAGLGFWGGYRKYTVYACPQCGTTKERGSRAFIMPNDIILSIAYVF